MSGVQLRDRPGVTGIGIAGAGAASRLPIDPRMAARWRSVRHDQRRRRRRRLIGALSLVTVLVGAWLAARSPLLAVRHVTVHGVGRTTADQVRAATGLQRRRSILEVDMGQIRRRVEALPWVAKATVRWQWPATMNIAVTERVPVAQVGETAGQTAVVDGAGRVVAVGADALAVLRAIQPPLPVLVGGPLAGPAGSTLAPAVEGPLKVLAALQALLAGHARDSGYRVTDVTGGGTSVMAASLAPGGTRVVFGTTDQLGAKVVALRSVLAQLASGTVATIDLRVPDAPVLTEGQNSSRFSTTQRG